MKKNLEIRTITHKGIDVTIEVNYDLGEASLVSFKDNKYRTKEWVFAHRGLEYINIWLDILEAMQVAVKECKKELEFSLDQSGEFTEKQILNFFTPETMINVKPKRGKIKHDKL